jgi:hypothetical protein
MLDSHPHPSLPPSRGKGREVSTNWYGYYTSFSFFPYISHNTLPSILFCNSTSIIFRVRKLLPLAGGGWEGVENRSGSTNNN